MRYQLEAGAPREMFDNRGVGIPSKSKASSSELVDGYDLAQKFEYLPDDSVDSVRQQVVSPFYLRITNRQQVVSPFHLRITNGE